ncbi:type II toxin-antitoxin system PemK/MazF family toxin [Demequina pelophila]|uniref:type II toxin-antitoxin system PemK/MazF family toxin n=1 Tax=Demequina pelophila TaxID=1638984 RepID=UPI000785289E|nr:type II toxin-antitoxin system PemK/MazF family toxin [Demequina pelophila]
MSRSSLLSLVRRIVKAALSTPAPGRKAGPTPGPRRGGGKGRGASSTGYPGDFTGTPRVEYRPDLDGDPDPGEIVWTWVPFEEDHSQGKDRPVLLVGRDGRWLLGLMLTSKDHDADAADEARWGRRWMDIGTGPWDRQGRPSEVRLDRIIRVDPDKVRREGAILDRRVFDRVAKSL